MATPAARLRTDVAVAPRTRALRLRHVLGSDYRLGFLFVAPMVVLVLALVAYPFVYAVYLSLTQKFVGMPPVFVGFENYIRLASDGFFQRAVVNSFVFTFWSVAVKLVLGMVMALVLMSKIRYRSLFTGLLLIPWVAPTVVSALNFLWIYDGSLGVLNYLLVKVFRILPQGVGWLSEAGTAMASVIFVNVWRGFPFFGISLLAGMKAISADLYEAAAVDGANAVHRFRHVTLPGVRNILIIVTLLSTIWTFNDFAIIYILTKGGPGGRHPGPPRLHLRDGLRRPAPRRGHRRRPLHAAGAGRDHHRPRPLHAAWARAMSKAAIDRLQTLGSYGVLGALLLLVLFPFYWMTITSFKSEDQMRSLVSMFWPSPVVLDNYYQLLTRTDFAVWFRNSAVVAVSSTLLATAVGTIGAYALARLRFMGRAFMSSAVLITYLVPPSILFIPLYAQIRMLGLSDSLAGLIAAYPSFTVPFVTWLLMGYFESIPVELEEAAMIDGATRFGAFRRVILPLAAPGLLAAGLYAFTQAWNEFLYALVFITDVKQRTLPVGLSSFITGDVYGWGYLMAGAVLTTLPVIAVYIYLQKYMVEGLTAGGVKG